jgi:hypothetical protein
LFGMKNLEQDPPLAEAEPTTSDGVSSASETPVPALVTANRSQRHRKKKAGFVRRNLRWIALAVALLLAPVAWSYGRTLVAPGSENWSTRSVEWIKNHGGRGLVVTIENYWYSHHKPPVGGEPSGGIPNLGAPAPTTTPSTQGSPAPLALGPPPDIRPIASPPLKNEGDWQPIGVKVDHVSTMYAAYVRPDDQHTSLLTTVVWMNSQLVHPVLYAGTQLPGGKGWKHYAEIPSNVRGSLVAAFNSGFDLKDTVGGFYDDGQTGKPLVAGGATFVFYRDGTSNVGQWGRDVHMTSNVVAARQNLSLIVDHGAPVPGIATEDFHKWGATYGGAVLVWRSGLGIDKRGDPIFAAGDALSAYSLARILARAGAVRAMELDINHTWMSFDYFKPNPKSSWGVDATKMLDNQYRTPYRYLSPDERDFVAIFLR